MPYDPNGLFTGAAPYYAAYRPGYPPEVFTTLRERFGLDRTQQVLDLGCGTGRLTLPLAKLVAHIHAVDPDSGMLDHAATLAAAAGIDTITWHHTDASHLAELDLPMLDLTTFGASFHWTDRPSLLADLDHRIVPRGAVVVVSGGPPGSAVAPPWQDLVTEVRTAHLGPDRRAGAGTYQHPHLGHAEVLAASPFSDIDTRTWTRELDGDIDSVVGLQFSYSYSAPSQFADEKARARFETDLHAALTDRFGTDAVLTEHHTTELIIATRPTR
ncbi:class I SAM-dependent methyltransferase [Nocardia vermiculata]|uniref:Class I SAM-dependent methyltransferase n=1 Tax=Nocardia vermiculata TaxID=257274 RepID=A0A846Y5P7_9NOCA|nr:class I SAM-dependent methyltransferase [Nocardia vermiculata]NKY54167.1 class I SAM-dependent methyltransferase [Nocardia vermiculata]